MDGGARQGEACFRILKEEIEDEALVVADEILREGEGESKAEREGGTTEHPTNKTTTKSGGERDAEDTGLLGVTIEATKHTSCHFCVWKLPIGGNLGVNKRVCKHPPGHIHD